MLRLSAIEAERDRRSLLSFVENAWGEVDPSPYVETRLFRVLIELLEAVARGELLRLAINVAPRSGKSLLISVLFPAWLWTSTPEVRFLTSSYGEELAVRDSARCRRLIESQWYTERYGRVVRLRDDQNSKFRFENTRGGARVAVSIGGSGTGEGGDIAIIDDPHKLEDVNSPVARRNVIDWYRGNFSTRLNDPRNGAMIAVGQRSHASDLFAHLLSEGDWEHVCLPAEFEPTHPHRSPLDWRTTPGELLCPERYGIAEHERLKRALGSEATAALLQQRPAPAGGSVFLRHWWRWYEVEPHNFDVIVQSWDLAFDSTEASDFVVGQAWGRFGPNYYLLRQTRERMSFTESVTAIENMTTWLKERYPGRPGHGILIERAANGHAAIDTLRRSLSGVIAVPPEGSKLSRAKAVTPLVEAGNVWLPGVACADGRDFEPSQTPQWVQAFVHEAETFPRGSYDDVVDAMCQALRRLERGGLRLRGAVAN